MSLFMLQMLWAAQSGLIFGYIYTTDAYNQQKLKPIVICGIDCDTTIVDNV